MLGLTESTGAKMPIDEKTAELHEELRVFEVLVQSPGWNLLKRQWQPLLTAAIGAALSGKATDRSFVAGKANGMKYFLEYPEKHIRTLQNRLKGQPERVEE